MPLIPMPQDRTTDGAIPPALPTLADPADQFGHLNRRAGYGSESRDALVERQTRAGGAMEAGVGAALYARIDALTAERDALRADAARLADVAATASVVALWDWIDAVSSDRDALIAKVRAAIDAAMQGRGAA